MKRSTDITCVFATLAEAQPLLELLGAQIRTVTTFPSFRAPACGVSVAIVGGTKSGVVVLREQSKPRSLLPKAALKTWTAMTFVPVTR